MARRPIPVTSCTACGKVGYYQRFINARCGHIINGKPCSGRNLGATEKNRWAECPSCKATGWTGETCKQCEGAGWLFVRRDSRHGSLTLT